VALGNERTPDGGDGVNEAFRVRREGKRFRRVSALLAVRSREILISNLLKQSAAGKRVDSSRRRILPRLGSLEREFTDGRTRERNAEERENSAFFASSRVARLNTRLLAGIRSRRRALVELSSLAEREKPRNVDRTPRGSPRMLHLLRVRFMRFACDRLLERPDTPARQRISNTGSTRIVLAVISAVIESLGRAPRGPVESAY